MKFKLYQTYLLASFLAFFSVFFLANETRRVGALLLGFILRVLFEIRKIQEKLGME